MSLLRQASENIQVEIPECDQGFDILLRDMRGKERKGAFNERGSKADR